MRYLRSPGELSEHARREQATDAARMRREAKLGNVCTNCGTSDKTCESRLVKGGLTCCQSCEHPEDAKTQEAK